MRTTTHAIKLLERGFRKINYSLHLDTKYVVEKIVSLRDEIINNRFSPAKLDHFLPSLRF